MEQYRHFLPKNRKKDKKNPLPDVSDNGFKSLAIYCCMDTDNVCIRHDRF